MMVSLGRGGFVDLARVVLIGRANSAPLKRLLDTTAPDKVIDLTYGEPRQALILFETGHLALVSLQPEDLLKEANHAS